MIPKPRKGQQYLAFPRVQTDSDHAAITQPLCPSFRMNGGLGGKRSFSPPALSTVSAKPVKKPFAVEIFFRSGGLLLVRSGGSEKASRRAEQQSVTAAKACDFAETRAQSVGRHPPGCMPHHFPPRVRRRAGMIRTRR